MLAARRVLHNPGPPDKNHLMAWYDATQLTGLADGAPLATWPDLSGHGRDAVSSATPDPTYSAAGLAGKPAVHWISTSNLMANAVDFTWPAVITAAGVFQFATAAGGIFSSNTNGSWEFGISAGQWSVQSGDVWGSSSATGLTNAHDFAAIFTTTGTWSASLDIDGANVPLTHVGAGGVNRLDTVLVGGADNLGKMTGMIGELLLYDQAEDPAALHTYLSTKWGV